MSSDNPFISASELTTSTPIVHTPPRVDCCEICVHNDPSRLCGYDLSRCTTEVGSCSECRPCTHFTRM